MRRTLRTTALAACLVPLALAPLGCNNNQKTPAEKSAEYESELAADVRAVKREFRQEDPVNAALFDTAYGYAVFPRVGRGAAVVGITQGRGEVYQGGELVGYGTISQATVGASVGGQQFAEIIFFKDARAMDRFKDGRLEFASTANAVIVDEGGGSAGNYEDGVIVFIMPKGGLMVDASIGGQGFGFTPIN